MTPFYALNPTQKAAILAFVCNELLCNKDVNAYVLTVLHEVTLNGYGHTFTLVYIERKESHQSINHKILRCQFL